MLPRNSNASAETPDALVGLFDLRAAQHRHLPYIVALAMVAMALAKINPRLVCAEFSWALRRG